MSVVQNNALREMGKRGLVLSVSAGALLSVLSPAVLAQDAANDGASGGDVLDEITVTAQRREQTLQDVPIAVSAFSADAIARNQFEGVTGYLSRTPNVSFITTGGRDRKNISIRGISNFLDPDNDVRPATIGFFLDEFSIAGSTVNPPIMDIERIEVLRGPQGTYFGRNAVGGAVNIITKKPNNEWYGETTLDYSSFNTRNLEGIFNAPIIEDVLALRGTVKWRATDGNIENINAIGGGNDSEYLNARLAARFTPNERLTVDLAGSITDEESGMREGVPSGVFSNFGAFLFSGVTGGEPDPDGVGFFPENTDKVNFNRPQSVGSEFKYATSTIKYDFDAFTLTSITGIIDSRSFLEGDIDGGSIDAFYEEKPLERDSISTELRAQSNTDSRLQWTVGGIYARDRGNVDQFTFAGSEAPFGFPEDFVVTSSLTEGKLRSLAAFAELEYAVTDRLSATVGARYTNERVESRVALFSGGAVSNFLDDTATFDDISPRFILNYEWSDALTTYASVSKGFKAGGVQASRVLPETSFDPETLWNYEVGAKAVLFDNRLRANAAVFYMDWNDLQTDFAVGILDDDGNIAFETGIENAESARSIGAELELNAILAEGLTVNGAVGFLDSEYVDFLSLIEGENVRLDGFTTPNAPRWTLSGDIQYLRPVTDNFDAFIRTEWNYRGSIVPVKDFLVEEGFPFEVPSYHNVNLRIGVESDRYRLVGYVENLLDAVYFTNAYQKAFIGGLHVEPSRQVFGVRFTYKTN